MNEDTRVMRSHLRTARISLLRAAEALTYVDAEIHAYDIRFIDDLIDRIDRQLCKQRKDESWQLWTI